MLKALMFGCSVALLGTVGTASAQDWTKSKWGPNDEIGAANNMSPDIVMKAAGLIKTGKTYGLGIETNSKTPAFPPRTFKVLVLQPGQAGGSGLGPNMMTSSRAGSASAARSTGLATLASTGPITTDLNRLISLRRTA
jgi:hypothetical protein